MPDSSSPALRSASFSFHDPSLWLARARLYPRRIDLTGWHLRGRYRRRIPLNRILQADAPGPRRLLLWLSDGEVVRLRLRDAHAWQRAIDAQVQRRRDGQPSA